MARRIPINLNVVDPTHPRMRVNIGNERRWLFGSVEGWVVLILLGLLLLGGGVLLAYTYFRTPPAPTAPTTTSATAKPAIQPTTAPKVSVEIPGLERAAAALQSAADRLAAQAAQPVTPPRLEISGEVGVNVWRENTPPTPPPLAARRPTPQELDEATARWLERNP